MATHSPCALHPSSGNNGQEGGTTEMGAGGVPKDPKNAGNPVFTCNEEFPTPEAPQPGPDEWFQGYGNKPQNPMYRTSSSSIGKLPPSVHNMPTSFHCKSQKFSEHLGQCGPYRDHSFNIALDKSKV